MKVTKILIGLMFLFSNVLLAFHENEPEGDFYTVRGEAYVKVDESDIEHLHTKLYLTKGGSGRAYIHLHDRSKNKKKTLESINYFVEREHGRTIFYMIFPYKTEGEIAIMIGTYMRDSDYAIYSGDIFVGPVEMLKSLNSNTPHFEPHEELRHLGTFSFVDHDFLLTHQK